MNLLISTSTNWILSSVIGLIVIFVISVILYAFRTAECFEIDDMPGEDMEPCSYKEIMNCERPYIEHQYN